MWWHRPGGPVKAPVLSRAIQLKVVVPVVVFLFTLVVFYVANSLVNYPVNLWFEEIPDYYSQQRPKYHISSS